MVPGGPYGVPEIEPRLVVYILSYSLSGSFDRGALGFKSRIPSLRSRVPSVSEGISKKGS